MAKRQEKQQVEFAFSSTQAMEQVKTGNLRMILIVVFSCKTYLLSKLN